MKQKHNKIETKVHQNQHEIDAGAAAPGAVAFAAASFFLWVALDLQEAAAEAAAPGALTPVS